MSTTFDDEIWPIAPTLPISDLEIASSARKATPHDFEQGVADSTIEDVWVISNYSYVTYVYACACALWLLASRFCWAIEIIQTMLPDVLFPTQEGTPPRYTVPSLPHITRQNGGSLHLIMNLDI